MGGNRALTHRTISKSLANDPYSELGVSRTANADEINKAFPDSEWHNREATAISKAALVP